MALVLVPVGWDPLACDSLRERGEPLCVGEGSSERELLRVVYWSLAGREPHPQEYAAQARPDQELPRDEREERLLRFADALLAGRASGYESPTRPTRRESEAVWSSCFEVEGDEDHEAGSWTFFVRWHREDRRSAHPREGGWRCELTGVLDGYGDDRELPAWYLPHFTALAGVLFEGLLQEEEGI